MVREKQQQRNLQQNRQKVVVPRSSSSANGSNVALPFIGFSAFADSTGTSASRISPTGSASGGGSPGSGGTSSPLLGLRPNPVYTSLEHHDIRSAFGRLRKKDAITKCKALEALIRSFGAGTSATGSINSGSTSSSSGSTGTPMTLPKKDLIEALSHYTFLFHNIYPSSDGYPHNGCVIYDNYPTVRYNSLQLWSHVLPIIPKATATLLLYSNCTSSSSTMEGEGSTAATTTSTTTTAIGAIYCSRNDPSREVSTLASSFYQKLTTILSEKETTLLHNAVASHIVTILSSVKTPRKSSATTTSTSNNNEQQQQQDRYEEQVERYERIIVTAIQAMAKLMQEQELRRKQQPLDCVISLLQLNNSYEKILWKYINNPNHDSFRNATYRLLSCCLQNTSLCSSTVLHQQELAASLLMALQSEKNPSNTYLLLEAVTLYTLRIVTSLPTYTTGSAHSTNHDGWWASFPKALSKQLRHACYSCSPSSLYTGLLLPLIASTTDKNSLQIDKILTALYDGHHSVVSQEDTVAIMTAVSECCTYILQRLGRYSTHEHPMGPTTEDLFMKVFTWYLTMYNTISTDINDAFTCEVANDYGTIILHLTEQNDNTLLSLRQRTTAALVQLTVSFNDDPSDEVKRPASRLLWKNNLARLLKVLAHDTKKTEANVAMIKESLLLGLRLVYASIVQSMKESSTKPTQQELDLLNEVINFVGLKTVLVNTDHHGDDDTAEFFSCVESFCINDVLPWTIQLSTASSSEQHYCDEGSIQACFILLKEVLSALDNDLVLQRQVWDQFLIKLIAGNCQLVALSLGLEILSLTPFVYCPAFESFAIDVGVVAAEDYSYKDAQHDNSHELELDRFFKACLGWQNRNTSSNLDEFDNVLVGQTVIHEWINSTCTFTTRKVSPRFQVSEELVDDADISGGGRDVLLRNLIGLACCRQANNDFCVISRNSTVQLFLEAWLRCGEVWDIHPWRGTVSEKDTVLLSVMQDVLAAAHRYLTSELLSSEINNELVNSHILWAQRAVKLIELQKSLSLSCQINNVTKDPITNLPLLDLVGLGDLDAWKKCSSTNDLSSERYASRLLSLLDINATTGANAENKDMILGGKTGRDASLLVQILKACIGVSQDHTSDPAHVYRYFPSDQAETLLNLLGRKDGLGDEFLELCCESNVTDLATDIAAGAYCPSNLRNLRNSIQCLDLLCSLLLGSMQPYVKLKAEAFVNPLRVTVGDEYWYLLKDGDQDKARRVTVTKIHDDDHPNPPYFTVRFLQNDVDNDDDANAGATSQEKQTIAGRLRRFISNPLDSRAQRRTLATQRLERMILEKVVTPVFFDADTTFSREFLSIIAESINIVLHRFGLFGNVGIGSTRYDVFQLLSKLQNTLIRAAEIQTDCYREMENEAAYIERTSDSSINSSLMCSCESALYCLSLALGGGVLTEPSCCGFSILNFDPASSVNALGRLYAITGWREMRHRRISSCNDEIQFETAAIMWLGIASCAAMDAEFLSSIGTAVNYVSSVVFSDEDWREYDSQHLIRFSLAIMSGIEALHQQATLVGLTNDEGFMAESVPNVIGCFVNVWDAHGQDSVKSIADQRLSTSWHVAFIHYLRLLHSTTSIPAEVKKYENKLCQILFVERKRWFGYQLLRMMSSVGMKYDEGNESYYRTLECFKRWSQGLPPDEVNELEEDCRLISQLIPKFLLDELSIWNENEDELSNAAVAGRFLSWLVFLDLLDACSTLDARNRGALISYVQYTHAGKSILKLSATYLSGQRNCYDDHWMSCTSIEKSPSSLNEEQLAVLVFFRSAQSLPTVVKSWWNEDCHRSIQSIVSQFIETQVSPETLRQELQKIKVAKNLGEMHVTGSIVSREITAVYEQDEVSKIFNYQMYYVVTIQNCPDITFLSL